MTGWTDVNHVSMKSNECSLALSHHERDSSASGTGRHEKNESWANLSTGQDEQVRSCMQGGEAAPKAGCSPNADSPKPPSPLAPPGAAAAPKADSPKPSTGAVSGTSGEAKGLLVAGAADRTAAAPQSVLEPLRHIGPAISMSKYVPLCKETIPAGWRGTSGSMLHRHEISPITSVRGVSMHRLLHGVVGDAATFVPPSLRVLSTVIAKLEPIASVTGSVGVRHRGAALRRQANAPAARGQCRRLQRVQVAQDVVRQ